MPKSILLTLLLSLTCMGAYAQPMVPDTCVDAYCNTVRRLERGDTVLDYAAFRHSFIESPVFRKSKHQSSELQNLLNLGERYWHAGDPARVVETLNEALRIDYTSMAAHLRIRQAYAELGDTANSLRSRAIEFGLLRSILAGGDGRTCATAWPVIQIEEEYFILEMLRAKLQTQSLHLKGGFCDKMVTRQQGKKKTYFFEVTKVFDAYDK